MYHQQTNRNTHKRDKLATGIEETAILLSQWLSAQQKVPSLGAFSTWDVNEIAGCKLQPVDILAPAVSDHLMSEDLLESATDLLPPSKLRAFVQARLPATRILKRGVLGEVLAVRLLEEFHNHVVPIKKLRYRTASHDSPKATDVLAVKVNDRLEITEVAYVEAKYRSTRDRIGELALVAHDQLKNDCNAEIPAIMGFAAQVLKDFNHPLYESVMAYLRDRGVNQIDSHHIFLVVDKDCWRETDLEKLIEHDALLEPLDVHIVMIERLCDKTELVYQAIGFEATPDED